jgi:hypothetical protein
MSGSLGGLRLAPLARAGPGQADLMCKSATMHPAALRQSRPAASGRIHAVFRRSIMVRFRHMPHVTLVTCNDRYMQAQCEAARNLFRLKGSNGQHAEAGVRATRCFTTVTSERRRCSSGHIRQTEAFAQAPEGDLRSAAAGTSNVYGDLSARRTISIGSPHVARNDPCIGPAVGMQFPSTRVQIGLSPRGIILFGCMIFAFFAEIDCPPGRLDFLSFGFPRTERRLRMAAAVRSRCAPTALQDRPRMISN